MWVYLLILIAFGADRLSKSWAAGFLADNGATQIHPLFMLEQTYNRGLAFGLMQGIGMAVGWLSVAIVAALAVYMIRLPRPMWLLRAGLALIIGGALGNLIDRVTTGQVLDFIATPLRPGVFNVADVMIHLGLLLSLAGFIFQRESLPIDEPEGVEI